MSYNLLINTSFKSNNRWQYKNCIYDKGRLISTNNTFAISQELVLPNPTKLYFRINFKAIKDIKKVTIGIQTGNKLNVIQKIPKYKKQQTISIVEEVELEKVKLIFIVESNRDISTIDIDKPLLVDIKQFKKSTSLKHKLDKELYFMDGYDYNNLYQYSEIKQALPDFKDVELEDAKIGTIFNGLVEKEIKIVAKFIDGNYYLVKLDYKKINKFGKILLTYGAINSIELDDEQICLIFKADKTNTLKLQLTPNDIISYKVNLKHLLIVDITDMAMQKDDIKQLSFI